ncbi:MAG: DNA translocase FtsK [bacterium]|nr:DNA translocase FtsK [bacterium]
MAGRSRKKDSGGSAAWYRAPWLAGVLLIACGLYSGLALTGDPGAWTGILEGRQPDRLFPDGNAGGPVGSLVNVAARLGFGSLWCWAVPLVLLAFGVGSLSGHSYRVRGWLWRALPLWLVTTMWLGQREWPLGMPGAVQWGGATGFHLASLFHRAFGEGGGRIFLTTALVIAALALAGRRLAVLGRLGGPLGRAALALGRACGGGTRSLAGGLATAAQAAWAARPRRVAAGDGAVVTSEAADAAEPGAASTPSRERVVHHAPAPAKAVLAGAHDGGEGLDFGGDDRDDDGLLALPGADGPESVDAGGPARSRPASKASRKVAHGPVKLPGLELLTPAGPEGAPIPAIELDAAADLLEATLRSFGVEGEVKDVRPGPVVTTYEYQPGPGIRVNQIVQRTDDLALAMRARSIRMEAPIPGKAAVGIEIPNPTARMVRLREVLELTQGTPREPLSVMLGKDVVGRPVGIDIAALPHLLVAGSTGSGKSVCLNALICNLLLRNDPSRLRLVLVDPKMLEMNVYNGIPHLLLPVVTDPREALKAMQWLVAQMELRYRQLAKWSVRNIKQYNEKIERGEVSGPDGTKLTEPMPYFVCIVDELADLMLQLGNDFEGPITRLAQKARAVGIHLVLATQRPSVDVLTGVIKANIPCRIAFRVIQKNDSRTILDMNGAEQLLGHGDMLYLQPGRALPVRVHGAFIDVDECDAVAAHWRQYSGTTEEISLVEEGSGDGEYTGEDELFDDAKRIVVLHQSGSTSLLQRRLRIGYTRAGRLMDMLEEAGVVGPFTGSKARDVLIKPEDLPMAEEGRA